MLFRAAASKLTLLLLAVLATAVESADITTAATKKNGPTARKLGKSKSKKGSKGSKGSEVKDVARTVTCDEYAEYSTSMNMHYMDMLISSFDLNAIQDATCGAINRQMTLPTIYNDPERHFAQTVPAEYVDCAADTFMNAVAMFEGEDDGMSTAGGLDWSQDSCESAIAGMVEAMEGNSRRELTETMVNDRQLFIFTLISVGILATIAAATATVVGGSVAIACSFEDCMGCDSVSGWYDSDGSTYNCDWYDVGDRCLQFGTDFSNFGYTARQACCGCGGGNQ